MKRQHACFSLIGVSLISSHTYNLYVSCMSFTLSWCYIPDEWDTSSDSLDQIMKTFNCLHTIDAPIICSFANILTRHGLQGRVSARCSFPVALLLTICRPLLWLLFLSPDVRFSLVLLPVSHVSACFSVPAAEQHNPGVQQFSWMNLISYRCLSAVVAVLCLRLSGCILIWVN